MKSNEKDGNNEKSSSTTESLNNEEQEQQQPCRITTLITKHSTSFYSIPIQRQRWTDEQIHPVVNWGDLFFDLFYVAGAYNVGNIIKTNLDKDGILYFLGCFIPIMFIWIDKMTYDARFYTKNDIYHQIYEIFALCTLASSILHIRPVEILLHTNNNVEMFAFCLSILLSTTLTLIRSIEIIIKVNGGPEAFYAARRDILVRGVSWIFFLFATIISGIDFYSNNNNNNEKNDSYYYDNNNEGYSNSTYDSNESSSYNTIENDEDHHRLMAGAESYSSSANILYETNRTPIWLCLIGGIIPSIIMVILITIFFPNDGSHKTFTVPMNIDYSIHRYGEWIMLMLGESILSLLIVDVSDGKDYYITFFAGILSVILLQYMHFRSQPHHANEHAMRRSKEGGIVYFILIQIYSITLVIIGVSYKLLLYEYTYGNYESSSKYRFLQQEDELRFLAASGSSGPKYDTDDRRQRITNFFSGSLAITFFCSDAMILTHKGLKNNVSRCQCEHTHKTKVLGLLLILARIGLIVFVATLSQYETNPENVALVGLGAIITQLLLRGLSNIVFPDKRFVHHNTTTTNNEQHEHHHEVKKDGQEIIIADDNEVDEEEDKWPNMTHARADHSTDIEKKDIEH